MSCGNPREYRLRCVYASIKLGDGARVGKVRNPLEKFVTHWESSTLTHFQLSLQNELQAYQAQTPKRFFKAYGNYSVALGTWIKAAGGFIQSTRLDAASGLFPEITSGLKPRLRSTALHCIGRLFFSTTRPRLGCLFGYSRQAERQFRSYP
jgi:hypothetical protein